MNIKKLLLMLGCMAAVPVFAATTCQQRVDGNLDKTTSQKITLCLTEPDEPEETDDGPQVIYSSVQTLTPKPKNVWMREQKHKVYKDLGPVNSEYVERKRFSSYGDNTPTSADVVESIARAKEAIALGKEPAKRSSAKKPARKVKAAAKPAAQEPAPQPEQQPAAQPEYSEDMQPEDEAQYDQEAQMLENNPMAEPQEPFEQDNLMTEESFGYNATDPALQQ